LDLDTFIVSMFCLLDDTLKLHLAGNPLRQRGPLPRLADSEVLTIEVVGEYLGLAQDKAIFDYFRRHFSHLFPALAVVDRTTFTRQAANLCKLKEALWLKMIDRTYCDPGLALVDSFPVHVCRFARAPKCKSFRGDAGYGKDHCIDQIFYGFRLHVRVSWPGVITTVGVAPAGVSDMAMLEQVVEGTQGYCLADRNYWNPELIKHLSEKGIEVIAPFRKRSRDPHPGRSSKINRYRYRIETVFSQIVERFQVKRVWARDMWHFASRLMRKVLSHTAAIVLNREAGNRPLQLAQLLTK
jgi:hypothetical protein